TGFCPPEFKQDCAGDGCSGTTCKGVCSVDAECPRSQFCSARRCVPKLDNGAVCPSDSACGSGVCVDGVCCDAACTGQCEACNQPGKEGQCLPIPAGQQPFGTRPACASDTSECGGKCDGKTRDRCTYPDSETQCRNEACMTNVATLSAFCTGDGR